MKAPRVVEQRDHLRVRFDFRLVRSAPGWADPVVEIGDQRLAMSAAWSDDALGDLLNALIALLNGGSGARCLWTQEPSEWAWNFYRPDVQTVRVRIDFIDAWQRPVRPDTRLEADLQLRNLVAAIAGGAQRCLEEFGADGYVQQWQEHPFPSLQLRLLQDWLESGGDAPRYEVSDA